MKRTKMIQMFAVSATLLTLGACSTGSKAPKVTEDQIQATQVAQEQEAIEQKKLAEIALMSGDDTKVVTAEAKAQAKKEMTPAQLAFVSKHEEKKVATVTQTPTSESTPSVTNNVSSDYSGGDNSYGSGSNQNASSAVSEVSTVAQQTSTSEQSTSSDTYSAPLGEIIETYDNGNGGWYDWYEPIKLTQEEARDFFTFEVIPPSE